MSINLPSAVADDARHRRQEHEARKAERQREGEPELDALSPGGTSTDDQLSQEGQLNDTSTETPGVSDETAAPDDAERAARVTSLKSTRINWADFWTRDRNADWTAEPVLARGRLHSITAAAKAGKSLLTLDLAAAMATGRPILGGPSVEPLTVLYIDQEMTEDDAYERLADMGYGPGDDLSRLRYYQHVPLRPLNQSLGGQDLGDLVGDEGAEVVILDTLGRLTAGDENDAETYHAAYRHTFGPLKARGCTALRLDHAGHENQRARGSSAKSTDVDIAWYLEPTDSGLRLKATHRRIGWAPERIDLRRIESPLGFVIAEDSWPAGTKATADILDRLGVPLDATRRTAAAVLQGAGEGVRNDVLNAALRWRRTRGVDSFGGLS